MWDAQTAKELRGRKIADNHLQKKSAEIIANTLVLKIGQQRLGKTQKFVKNKTLWVEMFETYISEVVFTDLFHYLSITRATI